MEIGVIVVIIVASVFVLYIIGKVSIGAEIKQDPAIQQAIQFLIAAQSMPKGSENLRLVLKIEPSRKESLICQYQDIGDDDISAFEKRNFEPWHELYNRQVLEDLLVKKGFPSYTFINMLEQIGIPYGYFLVRDWKLAHPNPEYVNMYIDAIIAACQRSNIPLIPQECGSDYLVIEPK